MAILCTPNTPTLERFASAPLSLRLCFDEYAVAHRRAPTLTLSPQTLSSSLLTHVHFVFSLCVSFSFSCFLSLTRVSRFRFFSASFSCSFFSLFPYETRQVAFADRIIINKVDLVGEDELSALRKVILGINATALCFETNYSKYV